MTLEEALKRALPSENVVVVSSYGETICEGFPNDLLTEYCILNRECTYQSDSPYGYRVIRVQTAHSM
jgi:hypothetical protein